MKMPSFATPIQTNAVIFATYAVLGFLGFMALDSFIANGDPDGGIPKEAWGIAGMVFGKLLDAMLEIIKQRREPNAGTS
ncbi:hypothetical protein [Candidatus Poriferisocius sp.]|uniref:hypothetical protein n=1 Tax=Candidatus Poriferisocius sp. TaxID=3101276 RepID=UPI003B02DAB3